MELIVDGSPASQLTLLVSNYLGYVKADKIIIKLKEDHSQQCPILKTRDQEITEGIVIAKYLASQSHRDVYEILCGSKFQTELDKWFSFAAERNLNCGDASSISKNASVKEQMSNQNITRWFDHIQNLPGIFGVDATSLEFIPIKIETSNQTKKEKKVDTATIKENKKEKIKTIREPKTPTEPKNQKENVTDARPIEDVTRLDIRVGRVIKVWNHTEAERLFCEEIDIGESLPRKIASGLRDHIRQEEFENALVLVISNMKEKSLRGFPSHGMVLCGRAKNSEGNEKVELLVPPPHSKIGERVMFDGLNGEPDSVLSTKTGKNPFVAVQPNFRLDDNGVAFYKSYPFSLSSGNCKCSTIRNGEIS